MSVDSRELNVLQISHALGIPYGSIYQTIRFFTKGRIPVRKFRGRLLVPADALPLLLRIHNERKNPKIPKGWVKVSEFSRRHGINPQRAIRWAQRFGILQFRQNHYYIHEDSTEEIRLLLSICKTGQPPRNQWVRLTEAVRSETLRARIHRLHCLYEVRQLKIGKSVYLRQDDLEFLLKEAEVMKRGRNHTLSVE